ncbi:hypothetical protein EXIGLDRAFT_726466 [Exidia glandulosa HHB12029]|uniref:Uncharacterized protein n=1 Tax=Exidia glandulosa HHB12029 TaxID=1314781 RepID=A0A165MA52_EXIGL|nr:hypothetical protein EXIGLDRAFT_726466 [Exidia glandulosa HHB12029]
MRDSAMYDSRTRTLESLEYAGLRQFECCSTVLSALRINGDGPVVASGDFTALRFVDGSSSGSDHGFQVVRCAADKLGCR